MTRKEYKALRNKAYGLAGDLSKIHAKAIQGSDVKVWVTSADQALSPVLDDIDGLGYKLGYLNPENNEETD